MNGSTKCDLSCDKVVLDYQAMLRVAKVAVWTQAEREANAQERLRLSIHEGDEVGVYLGGRYIAEAAEELAIITDVLGALMGMATRSQVEWINVPTGKES
jgi:hypothetical protein